MKIETIITTHWRWRRVAGGYRCGSFTVDTCRSSDGGIPYVWSNSRRVRIRPDDTFNLMAAQQACEEYAAAHGVIW